MRRSLATLASALLAAAPLAAQAPPPDVATARAAWERHPSNIDSITWYGRRVGYTGDFAQAVAIYSEGLRRHPDEPHLLRHRGHRLLSLRRYPEAIADLARARAVVAGRPDEVEPDGQPNARGIPTSTLHSNIRYHLALALFLTGDFAGALPIWAEDAATATTLDQRVAATYWQVLTLAHLQRRDQVQALLAPIRADWDIIENGSYHRLLLWMQGTLPEAALLPADAPLLERQTVGNGIGQWHAALGRPDAARAAWQRVLATGPSAAFGVLAAEAGLRRLDGGR